MRGFAEPPVTWNADDWTLCGQGRSNVVLRDGNGTVLRLQKHDSVHADSVHDALERELWAHVPGFSQAVTPVERCWLFASHVLSPLLDFRAGAGALVQLPTVFLRQVESRLDLPLGSLGSLTGHTCWAILLPDHTYLPPRVGCTAPVFVVELKPKCGFLPTAASVPADSVKRYASRFSLHQQLKLAQGRIKQARATIASLIGWRHESPSRR